MDEITGFVSLSYILSWGGCAAITWLLTEALKKPLDKVFKLPTQYLAWVIAFILLLVGNIVMGSFHFGDILIYVVNAALIAFVSSGGHTLVLRSKGGTKTNESDSNSSDN